jgi:hypothetical protein
MLARMESYCGERLGRLSSLPWRGPKHHLFRTPQSCSLIEETEQDLVWKKVKGCHHSQSKSISDQSCHLLSDFLPFIKVPAELEDHFQFDLCQDQNKIPSENVQL